MLAAKAKKAGSASIDTRLTLRPPSLTGRVAWDHSESDKSLLVRELSAVRCN